MNDTIVTIVGNLTDDPELRFTPSGAAVAKFRVASTPRKFDKDANEWRDMEALFMACSAWRQMAENIAESLKRGDRVIVQGRLKQRSYETREGEKRTVIELECDEVGPSLKWNPAEVKKMKRSGGDGGGGTPGGSAQPATGGFGEDPWATGQHEGPSDLRGAVAGAQARQGGGFDDEPPY